MIFLPMPADQRNDFYGRLNHDKHSICPWNQLYSGHGLVSRVQRNPVKLLRQGPPPSASFFFFLFLRFPIFVSKFICSLLNLKFIDIILCESFLKRALKIKNL